MIRIQEKLLLIQIIILDLPLRRQWKFWAKNPRATTERILGHEMGHAATGIGDTGPNNMDNVRQNENPIAIELGQPERIRY